MRMRLTGVGGRRIATGIVATGLLTGCGAVTSTAPVLRTAHAKTSNPSESATGNRHAAEQEAARLLGMATLPPTAVAASSHPQTLDQPALGGSWATSSVDRVRFWRVSTGLDSTMAWIRAHPPRRLTLAGSSSGGGPASRGSPAYRTAGVGYSEPDRPGMQDLLLVISVATLPSGGSAIRTDGMASWLDPQPIRDERPGKRLRVTVAGGCPGTDRSAVDVQVPPAQDRRELAARLLPAARPVSALVCDYSGMNGHPVSGLLRSRHLDATAAARLARIVAGLPLSHPDGTVMHCPMDDGTATILAFAYKARPDVDLWLDRNGCAAVTNGLILARAGDLGQAVSSAERVV